MDENLQKCQGLGWLSEVVQKSLKKNAPEGAFFS